jgi:hypothetical protein
MLASIIGVSGRVAGSVAGVMDASMGERSVLVLNQATTSYLVILSKSGSFTGLVSSTRLAPVRSRPGRDNPVRPGAFDAVAQDRDDPVVSAMPMTTSRGSGARVGPTDAPHRPHRHGAWSGDQPGRHLACHYER